MLELLLVILLISWILGIGLGAGSTIHVLLVVFLVVLILRVVRGRGVETPLL